MNETIKVEYDMVFSKRNYQRKYIPVFIKYNKEQLEHYTFIKTINAGDRLGHILQGGNDYFMCLSTNDDISAEQRTMEPMGFRREYIHELEALAETFNKMQLDNAKRSYNSINRKHPKVVVPPVIDNRVEWQTRMDGHYIINVITKQEIHLSGIKCEIVKQCGITIHLLNVIIHDGIVGKDWCYKGKRLDGLSWEQYFASQSAAIVSQ